MFRRRKKEERAEGACTFCGFVPEVPSPTCPQCYYEFDKSPRDQGTRPDAADQADILALLEAEPTAMEEEAPLVEAVLAMDDVTVDVPAFDAPSPVDDDQEVVGEHEFMESAGPTMSETKAFEDQEEATLEPSDVRPDAGTFEVPTHDPTEDIAEPVPMNIGGLHSPAEANEQQGDLSGHTEPIPELPDLDAIEEPIQIAAVADEAPEPAVTVTPELPDLDGVPEAEPTPQPAPPVQHPNRWMPWTAKDAWTLSAAQTALVPIFEAVGAGQVQRAAADLDHIGPHLPDDLDLVYHVGLLLKQLGRDEALQTLLVRVSAAQPDDARVHAAVHHLR
ncbi:MAG: hypothetical protein DWC11_05025 [Candidatus Poseidoniales archaeon]|nr:MAG: hypothetical protein DWC11_05025 [Candidatus Poseidoniales archaeon]